MPLNLERLRVKYDKKIAEWKSNRAQPTWEVYLERQEARAERRANGGAGAPRATRATAPVRDADKIKDLVWRLMNAEEVEMECSICREELTRETLHITKCGHYFCNGCVAQILPTNGHRCCATCREPL